MKIRFSRIAVYKLDRISEYLILNWSESSNDKFLNKLISTLESIRLNPKIYPESILVSGLRRCVFSKQTSFLYQTYPDSNYILTIFDSRQDPKKFEKK
jgi:plasmid stabilization system protein ParE